MKKLFVAKLSFLAWVLLCFGVFFSTSSYAQNLATAQIERNIPRFQQQVERMNQGDVDILWIGDSITNCWESTGKDVWEEYYGNRKAMNFGISADHTAHVLWRLNNAPMENISPKIVILLIGTNNLGLKKPNSDEPFSTPAETVEGVQAIVDRLTELYPETKILLMELFPRGAQANDPLRLGVNEVNTGLEAIYSHNAVDNVQLYNINELFLAEDGALSCDIMPDYLHLSEKGFELWAKAIEPMIADALEETPEECQPAKVEVDWWTERFDEKNNLLKKGDVELLMVGDSITHFWDKTPYWEQDGSEIWRKYLDEFKAINLGHGGDRTQNILWRLENYDFGNVNPKAAVLLIGVNNTWERNYDRKDVALGQRRVVQKMRELFPDMKIFVLPIFPSTCREDQQACNDAINALTPFYMRDLENVEFLDINKVFLNQDGVLTKDVMPDLLHPNAFGYELWGAALYLPLKEAFK